MVQRQMQCSQVHLGEDIYGDDRIKKSKKKKKTPRILPKTSDVTLLFLAKSGNTSCMLSVYVTLGEF